MSNSNKHYQHLDFEDKYQISLPEWFNLNTYQTIKYGDEFDLIDFYFNYLIRFNAYAKQCSGALKTKKFINLLSNEKEKRYFDNYFLSFEHNLPLRQLTKQEKDKFIDSLKKKTDIQHIFNPKVRNAKLFSQSVKPVSQSTLNFQLQIHKQYQMFFMKDPNEVELMDLVGSLTDQERHLIYKYSKPDLMKELNDNPKENLNATIQDLKDWNATNETIQNQIDSYEKAEAEFEPSKIKLNRLIELLEKGTKNPHHDPLHFFTQHIPGQDNAMLSIDLNFTNDQLKSDFAKTLNALRKTHNTIKEAKQQTSKEQLFHYFESNFFEYIDIRFWLKHKGVNPNLSRVGLL